MRPSPPKGTRPASRVVVELGGPLTPARFIERPNRFLVLAVLDSGERVATHLPDPGRLRELLVPGRRVWLKQAEGPRKTRWTCLLVESPEQGELVCLDTNQPNRLLQRALSGGFLPEFQGWKLERSEFTWGGSRFDFVLGRSIGQDSEDPIGPGSHQAPSGRRDVPPGRMVVEAKGVSLVEDRVARFPDAVTDRGRVHLEKLAAVARTPGWAAAVVFVLQRERADRIVAAEEIDPRFAGALRAAREAGVKVLGRRCRVHLDRVELLGPVPVE